MNNIRFLFECSNAGYMSSFDEGTIQMKDSSSGIGIVTFLGTHSGWTMKITIRNGVREGQAVVYDAYSVVQAKITYCHGKITGPCELYDEDGLLSFRGYFDNGMKSGIGITYNKGIITAVSEYVNDEVFLHTKLFENNQLIELDSNGVRRYIGGYEETLFHDYVRHGEGKELDVNGHDLLFKGKYQHGHRNGFGIWYVNHRPRYQGNWVNDLPEGHGFLLNENGGVQYEGEWKKGWLGEEVWYGCDVFTKGSGYGYKAVQYITEYTPQQLKESLVNNVTIEEDEMEMLDQVFGDELERLLSSVSSSVLSNSSELSESTSRSTISSSPRSSDELDSLIVNGSPLPYSATTASIPTHSCNETQVTEIDFMILPFLESISIQYGCFIHCQQLHVHHLEFLKSLQIGDYCFSRGDIVHSDTQQSFILENCPQLSDVVIGKMSFCEYSSFHINSKQIAFLLQ